MENLYYYARECCRCSITDCPRVQSLAAIKKVGERPLLEAPVFWSYGLHLVFLLSPSWNSCSPFQQKILQENLEWQKKSLLPHPATLVLSLDPFWTSCPCIFQWGRFSVDWLSLIVSHPWGCLFLGAQELTSLAGKLNLATTYSGRRRSFSRRCYKRTCEVITVICLHTLETFLP